MAYNFKALLDVPESDAVPLRLELQEIEWARYGRNVHMMLMSPRLTDACNSALFRADPKCPALDVARRIRLFLTTGVIAS